MKNIKLTDKEITYISHGFFSAIDRISENKHYLQIFFQAILSPTEYRDVLLRWEVLNMLSRNTPYQKISSRLGVSMSKVNRASLLLFNPWGDFSKIKTYLHLH